MFSGLNSPLLFLFSSYSWCGLRQGRLDHPNWYFWYSLSLYPSWSFPCWIFFFVHLVISDNESQKEFVMKRSGRKEIRKERRIIKMKRIKKTLLNFSAEKNSSFHSLLYFLAPRKSDWRSHLLQAALLLFYNLFKKTPGWGCNTEQGEIGGVREVKDAFRSIDWKRWWWCSYIFSVSGSKISFFQCIATSSSSSSSSHDESYSEGKRSLKNESILSS